MNKKKFTPGPWYAFRNHVRHAEPDLTLPVGTLPNGLIARCATARDWPEAQEEAKANAALIAAAPEMYQMLERILDYMTGGPILTKNPSVEEIAHLLKKARGGK